MFLKLNTQWPQGTNPRSGPAGARHRLRPSTIFRPRSDGVTGYVTSSHGAATPLRDGVTGHLAGNQPRPGASLWQDAGAPAGWADGQVGTSHFVQAPSMRPIHATATSRAIHVPASMTKRGMIPLALSRPSPSALYRTGQGTRSPSERPNNTLAAFLRDPAVPDHSRGNTRRSEGPGSQPRLRKTRRSRRTLRAPL
jgi:hypothetical protein